MYMILRKFLMNFFSLLMIVTGTFVIMKKLPGDPFTQEKALPQEVLDSLFHHYHLQDPLIMQYLHYLSSVCKGDFGSSLVYQSRSVRSIIEHASKISFQLGVEACMIAVFLGILSGSIAAFFEKKWQTNLITWGMILSISIPPFLLATLLQEIFAVRLQWLPIAKWGSFSHTLLPALSLAVFPAASLARLLRVQMLEVLQQDFIKLARLKGLNTFEILYKHTLKNAIVPILGYLGPLFTTIVTGSFLIEKIFGIPGLGNWFVASVIQRDYPLILGITCYYGILLLVSIYILDLIAMLLDPRLRGTILNGK